MDLPQYGVGGGSDARHGVAMGERAHNMAKIIPSSSSSSGRPKERAHVLRTRFRCVLRII